MDSTPTREARRASLSGGGLGSPPRSARRPSVLLQASQQYQPLLDQISASALTQSKESDVKGAALGTCYGDDDAQGEQIPLELSHQKIEQPQTHAIHNPSVTESSLSPTFEVKIGDEELLQSISIQALSLEELTTELLKAREGLIAYGRYCEELRAFATDVGQRKREREQVWKNREKKWRTKLEELETELASKGSSEGSRSTTQLTIDTASFADGAQNVVAEETRLRAQSHEENVKALLAAQEAIIQLLRQKELLEERVKENEEREAALCDETATLEAQLAARRRASLARGYSEPLPTSTPLADDQHQELIVNLANLTSHSKQLEAALLSQSALVNSLTSQLEEADTALDRVQTERDGAHKKLEEQDLEARKQSEYISELQQRLLQLETTIADHESDVETKISEYAARLNAEVETKEAALALANSRLGELSDNRRITDNLSKLTADLRKTESELRHKLADASSREREALRMAEDRLAQVVELQERLEASNLKDPKVVSVEAGAELALNEEIRRLKQEIEDLNTQMQLQSDDIASKTAALKHEQLRSQSLLDQLRITSDKLQQAEEALQEERAIRSGLELNVSEASEALKQVSRQIETLERKCALANQECEAADHASEELRLELKHTQEELRPLAERLELVEAELAECQMALEASEAGSKKLRESSDELKNRVIPKLQARHAQRIEQFRSKLEQTRTSLVSEMARAERAERAEVEAKEMNTNLRRALAESSEERDLVKRELEGAKDLLQSALSKPQIPVSDVVITPGDLRQESTSQSSCAEEKVDQERKEEGEIGSIDSTSKDLDFAKLCLFEELHVLITEARQEFTASERLRLEGEELAAELFEKSNALIAAISLSSDSRDEKKEAEWRTRRIQAVAELQNALERAMNEIQLLRAQIETESRARSVAISDADNTRKLLEECKAELMRTEDKLKDERRRADMFEESAKREELRALSAAAREGEVHLALEESQKRFEVANKSNIEARESIEQMRCALRDAQTKSLSCEEKERQVVERMDKLTLERARFEATIERLERELNDQINRNDKSKAIQNEIQMDAKICTQQIETDLEKVRNERSDLQAALQEKEAALEAALLAVHQADERTQEAYDELDHERRSLRECVLAWEETQTRWLNEFHAIRSHLMKQQEAEISSMASFGDATNSLSKTLNTPIREITKSDFMDIDNADNLKVRSISSELEKADKDFMEEPTVLPKESITKTECAIVNIAIPQPEVRAEFDSIHSESLSMNNSKLIRTLSHDLETTRNELSGSKSEAAKAKVLIASLEQRLREAQSSLMMATAELEARSRRCHLLETGLARLRSMRRGSLPLPCPSDLQKSLIVEELGCEEYDNTESEENMRIRVNRGEPETPGAFASVQSERELALELDLEQTLQSLARSDRTIQKLRAQIEEKDVEREKMQVQNAKLLGEAEGKVSQLASALEEVKRRLVSSENNEAQASSQRAEFENGTISSLTRTLEETISQKSEMERTLSLLRAEVPRIDILERELADKVKVIQDLEIAAANQKSSLEDVVADLQSKLVDSGSELALLREALVLHEQQISKMHKSDFVEQLQHELAKASEESLQMQQQIESLTSALTDRIEELDEAGKLRESLEQQSEKLRIQLEQLREQSGEESSKTTSVSKLEEQIWDLDNEAHELRDKVEQLTTQLGLKEEESKLLESRIQILLQTKDQPEREKIPKQSEAVATAHQSDSEELDIQVTGGEGNAENEEEKAYPTTAQRRSSNKSLSDVDKASHADSDEEERQDRKNTRASRPFNLPKFKQDESRRASITSVGVARTMSMSEDGQPMIVLKNEQNDSEDPGSMTEVTDYDHSGDDNHRSRAFSNDDHEAVAKAAADAAAAAVDVGESQGGQQMRVPLQYVRAVIMHYLLTNDFDRCFPVISAVLRLSPAQIAKVVSEHRKRTGWLPQPVTSFFKGW